MPTKLKRLVRARMEVTGESYVTSLRRIRECEGKVNYPTSTDPEVALSQAVAETIRVSQPRKGT